MKRKIFWCPVLVVVFSLLAKVFGIAQLPPNLPSPCFDTAFFENFDGVLAPTLPAGWSSTFTPGPADCSGAGTCAAGTNWITDNAIPYSPPNSAFHNAPACVTDSKLDSPTFRACHGQIIGAPNSLEFRQLYNLENGFDGAVLEISVDGGPFTDIVAAGGGFNFGGYNGTIASGTLSPIAGRAAWTGSSNGYINTRVQLRSIWNDHNLAFRFRLVTDCGNSGTGWRIDNVFVGCPHDQCNGPTPSPTPTPTAPPTITVIISGTISYCSNPVPGPVPNVTLTLTGSASGSTMSNSSGNYQFASLPSGGSYTVTPAKSALAPGSAGITTVDVIATQRHFLGVGTPLSGCRLAAADVNGDSSVTTVDVIAIQRFYLGISTGTGNCGIYQFNPATRIYSAIMSDQAGQNYDALIFGDVASPFVE